jgi:hypothetical protein
MESINTDIDHFCGQNSKTRLLFLSTLKSYKPLNSLTRKELKNKENKI